LAKFSVGLRSEYNYNAFSNHSDNFHNDNTQWSLNALYTTKLSKETLYFSARRWFDRVNYSLFNPTYIKNSPTVIVDSLVLVLVMILLKEKK